jgi:5-enolpyruvylshikimate-3-phosphate synthase
MASAVAAWSGVAKSVVVDDPACVSISYPTFWRDAAALGIDV